MRVNGSGSPVQYPTVTVGAEVLTVKVGLTAELILSRSGLTFQDVLKALQPNSRDPRKFDYSMQLFAACAAHNYPAGTAPTADPWVEKVEALGGDPESNAPFLTAIYAALAEALVKRWPSPLVKVQEPAANPTDETKAN